jgi:hypothetical protein
LSVVGYLLSVKKVVGCRFRFSVGWLFRGLNG